MKDTRATPEVLTELGTLSGHKYLSPDKVTRREELIRELIDRDLLIPTFEPLSPDKVPAFFTFAGIDRNANYKIYMDAFAKQLMHKPEL